MVSAAHEPLPDDRPPRAASEAALLAPPEGCPTPLEWREVLDRFLREADHWYCDRDGRRIVGRTWGSGPPLYFLNGLTGTHELFCLTIWLLREKFRCVAFDYPDSSRLSIEQLAEWPEAVADLHGDDAFSVFATGLGAMPAWALAARSPCRVRKLIVQGGLTSLQPTAAERAIAALGTFWPGRFAHVPGRWTLQQRTHRPWFTADDPSRFLFFLQSTGKQRTRGVAERFRAAAKFDARPLLPTLDVPVLMIRTEGEGANRAAAAEECARLLPRSRTELLHSCGLLPFLTHPHKLAKVCSAFLSEPDEPSSDA